MVPPDSVVFDWSDVRPQGAPIARQTPVQTSDIVERAQLEYHTTIEMVPISDTQRVYLETLRVYEEIERQIFASFVVPRWHPFRRTPDFYELPKLDSEHQAMKLLIKCLSPDQRECFKNNKYFHVKGGTTGTTYRIHWGGVYNIDRLKPDGSLDERFCVVPKGLLPIGDVLVAQKFGLELFEEETLRRANRLRDVQIE